MVLKCSASLTIFISLLVLLLEKNTKSFIVSVLNVCNSIVCTSDYLENLNRVVFTSPPF